MTDQRGRTWQAPALAPRVLDAGRTVAEQPLPWLGVAAVFFTNAVLTATEQNWWLAALEFATCILAVLSAAAVAKRASDPVLSRPAAKADPQSD